MTDQEKLDRMIVCAQLLISIVEKYADMEDEEVRGTLREVLLALGENPADAD